MNKQCDKNNIVLRQISDHIFQSIDRIRDDIEYIIFLRKNTKIQEVSNDFYIKQIDRFSRDVLITFGHILDPDENSNTLENLVVRTNDKTLKGRLNKIREKSAVIKKHRNKIIAHHDTKFNAKLGDYYPTQGFNYIYPIDPCFLMENLEDIEELMNDVFSKLKIDGIGSFFFVRSDLKNIFKKNTLGKADNSKVTIEFEHKCHAKKCLLE